jgi:predicted nucleotidyltransferase
MSNQPSDRGERSGREPPVRLSLLRLVQTFTLATRWVPGVTRIALVGSLATSKADPKDVDLLVSMEVGAALAPLALHARRLRGAAQSLGKGTDVFLASPIGECLGRVCEWRDCRPGVRLRCDALHCGKQAYLHDDLEIVRLPPSLIRDPPVILWPEVRYGPPVPLDMAQELLGPLRGEYLTHGR